MVNTFSQGNESGKWQNRLLGLKASFDDLTRLQAHGSDHWQCQGLENEFENVAKLKQTKVLINTHPNISCSSCKHLFLIEIINGLKI